MTDPPAWLAARWLPALFLLLGALAALAFALLRRRRPGLALGLASLAAVLACAGAGGLLLPGKLSFWLLVASGALLLVLVALLLFLGAWWPPLALLAAGLAVFALGGVSLRDAGAGLTDFGRSLLAMRLHSPWWLLLLALVPVIVLLSWPRLTRQEVRPWVSVTLRSAIVVLLALALAEPFLAQENRTITVLFVVDRSLSIPEDMGEDPDDARRTVDLRAARLRRFINLAVEKRGPGRERDKAGLVVFGRRPRLELPPSDAPRFNLRELPAVDDGSYTDIAAALKLALASFPEGSGKRVVLVSDGNENLGSAEDQARLAKTLGVQIDVLPLAAGRRSEEEVLVERIDAPPVVEVGRPVPIRVLVRSFNPNVVVGMLTVKQITDKEGELRLPLPADRQLGVEVGPVPGGGKGARVTRVAKGSVADRAGLEVGNDIVQVDGEDVDGAAGLQRLLDARKPGAEVTLSLRRSPVRVVQRPTRVRLRLGLNPFQIERPLGAEQRSYTYEAEFTPEWVETEGPAPKRLQTGLPRDRVQNNRAATHVVARGQGRVLLLEDKAGLHRELVDRLVEAGKGRFKVVAEPVDVLDAYRDRDKLSVFLSNFDCVILANVPADRISEEHQQAIRDNTLNQGCGLVMIGGPDGYGAGGWQNTPVEDALPVKSDIRSLKVQGKGGLVLIMHASEMADGNMWQKKIAKLAVERLSPADEVGVIDFGFAGCKWHVPFEEIGGRRKAILGQIDSMVPGDMPDFDPALQMAYDALSDPKKGLSAKHIIIISDGDPIQRDAKLLAQIKGSKITIATVGVATHGAPQDKALEAIATHPKRYYKVDDPKKLPAIYIKETRLVSQAFVHKKEFRPRLVSRAGPTAKLPDLLPLGGFVRTTPKDDPFVEVPILTPKFADQDFPLLAYWPRGLGKAVAFTSDAGKPEFWSRQWVEGGLYGRFWEQVVGYALRPVESGRLQMTTEYRDGKVRVTVDARTPDGKPDTDLRLRGGISAPGGAGRKLDLKWVQKNSGVYEAEVKADEAGSYFITAQATRTRKVKGRDGKEHEVEDAADSVRAGVTVPYSPEFADMESNAPLLERLRELTDGRAYQDDDDALAAAAAEGAVFRPVPDKIKSSLPFHHWLLFVAAGLLLADVAVRRLAFDPKAAAERAKYVWARLRGHPLPPPVEQEAVGRLRARPAAANGERAGRRFEGGLVAPVPLGADAPARARPAAARSAPADRGPEAPEAVPGDFAERLLKAKKKVWDEREKEKPEG